MEDYKVLAKIIQDYPDALSERKKLQALFSDFFPQDRLKRNTLLMVFDDGIVSEGAPVREVCGTGIWYQDQKRAGCRDDLG